MNGASVEFVIEHGPVALLYSAKGTALRERREDLPLLIPYFVVKLGKRLGKISPRSPTR